MSKSPEKKTAQSPSRPCKRINSKNKRGISISVVTDVVKEKCDANLIAPSAKHLLNGLQ